MIPTTHKFKTEAKLTAPVPEFKTNTEFEAVLTNLPDVFAGDRCAMCGTLLMTDEVGGKSCPTKVRLNDDDHTWREKL
jgi:hypothetical protein